jgi:hypothetical protein
MGGLIAEAPAYRMRILGANGEGAGDPELARHLYRLYHATASRRLRINDFRMPEGVVEAMLRSPAWEVVALTLDPAAGGPADGRPVAWGAVHRSGRDYAGFMCGVDPEYVTGRDFGAYRQLLLHVLRRAREIGATTLHLGMDADVEKARFGTTAHPTCMYVLSREHDAGDRMQEIVAAVGLRSAAAAGAAAAAPSSEPQVVPEFVRDVVPAVAPTGAPAAAEATPRERSTDTICT